jgi:hypothetical protein
MITPKLAVVVDSHFKNTKEVKGRHSKPARLLGWSQTAARHQPGFKQVMVKTSRQTHAGYCAVNNQTALVTITQLKVGEINTPEDTGNNTAHTEPVGHVLNTSMTADLSDCCTSEVMTCYSASKIRH